MPVAMQGTVSTFETASGTTAVIPYPSGVVAGELLVAHVMCSTNTVQTAPPTGWTYYGGQVGGSSTSGPSATIYYKRAVGGESGTVTFPGQSSAGRITGYMTRWSGVDTTTPFDVSLVSNASFTPSLAMPSITTVTPGAVLIHQLGISSTTSFDIDTLSGTTKIAGSTGTGRRHSIYHETRASAGATGSRTWTHSSGNSTTQNWSGITIALRPTTTGPTPFLKGLPSVAETTSATSITVQYPAGITAGELLTAHITHAAPNAPTTNPGGWVLVKSQNAATWRTQEPSSTVWYKIAGGSESGTSVTFVTDGSAGSVTGTILRWGNIDATAPMDAVATSAVHAGTFSVVTPPPVTTATVNARIVHTLAVESSSSADFTAPEGLTKNSTSGGVGRRQVTFSEVLATPGLAEERTFAIVPSDPPRPMHAISIAIKPGTSGAGADAPDPTPDPDPDPDPGDGGTGPVGPQPGSSPTLNARVTGIPAEPKTNGVVQVNVSGATALRLRVSTDAAGTTGVRYGSSFTPDSMGNARLTVSGLTPNVRYYYRIMMTNSLGGEFADTHATVGRLRTAPSGAATFSFDFASCMVNTNSPALRAIAGRADTDAFFLHLGDFLYADGTGTGIDNFRTRYNQRIRLADSQSLYAQMGMSYTPSDHDGMNNNGAAGSDPTAWANWNTMRNELFPMPASYYSFAWGRVRIIQIDTRSFKTNPSATDNASKTALGSVQKQWLKDQITNMREGVAVIAQDAPWIEAKETGGDSWSGFDTERQELATFFRNSGKHVTMLSGDAHSICADSGVNSPGGIAVFHGSPLINNSSIKGGPYSAGVWPSSAGVSNTSAYGRITVTDTGGTSIILSYQGLDGGNVQRLSLTKTYTVEPAGFGDVAASNAVGQADFPPPTIVVSNGPSIVGPSRAIASAAAIAPVVSASFAPGVFAPAPPWVVAEAHPVAATSGISTSATRAIATARAVPPYVEAIGTVEVSAPAAVALVGVVPPFASAEFGVSVSVPVSAAASASAKSPTLTAGRIAEVFSNLAEVYADALDPIPVALRVATVVVPAPQNTVVQTYGPVFGAGSGITFPRATTQARAHAPSATTGYNVMAVPATGSAAAVPVVLGLSPEIAAPMIQVLVQPKSLVAQGLALVEVPAPQTISVTTQGVGLTASGDALVSAVVATIGVTTPDPTATWGSVLEAPRAVATARAIDPFAQGTGAVTIFAVSAATYADAPNGGVSSNLPIEARIMRISVAPGGPMVSGGQNITVVTAGASAAARNPFVYSEAFIGSPTSAATVEAHTNHSIEAHIMVVVKHAIADARAWAPYLPAMEVWPIRWPAGFNPEAYDPHLIDRAKQAAGATLRMLTLYRVGGLPITVMPCTTTCAHPYTGGQFGNSYLPFYPILLESGRYANCFCSAGCNCSSQSTVLLAEPVGRIDGVKIDGELIDPSNYHVDDGNRLVRHDGGSWPACSGQNFTVTYLNAYEVDSYGEFVGGILALEFVKLFTTPNDCRLPRTVTQMARGGMNFEVTTEMFPEGLTQIQEVDVYLVRWNPHGLKTRPGVYSPDVQTPKIRTWG